jgi:hypothetical protein
MSEPGNDMRPSRGKVWLRLTAGEAMGRPLAEWAYRTPRFPSGIKRSDLTQAPEIGRETIIVWFLTNHIPAKAHISASVRLSNPGQSVRLTPQPLIQPRLTAASKLPVLARPLSSTVALRRTCYAPNSAASSSSRRRQK